MAKKLMRLRIKVDTVVYVDEEDIESSESRHVVCCLQFRS